MHKHYDTAVIGGGPAGMMAAALAAANGAETVLLEKNETPGRKLLITGKGRCNITNADEDTQRFIQCFGKKGKFLYSALHRFGVADTIRFFNKRGLATKVERGNRVFPVSDRASDVLALLQRFMKENGVRVFYKTAITKIEKEGNRVTGIHMAPNDTVLRADNYIICTGGSSYPGTGSTGDGFKWAQELGHTVVPPKPALVPLTVKEKWVKELQGLSLKNVCIRILKDEKKQTEAFGEALFTHNGVSGPIILDMSKDIGNLLKKGTTHLEIDFKPALDHAKLDQRLQRDFKEFNNKLFKNSLDKLLPKKLIPVMISLSEIDPQKKVNAITKPERKKLIHLLKSFRLTIRSLVGFEKAVVTSGGVSLKEINPRTMRSTILENLLFAGEILDLDGPTGGYNLQVCWSTAYVAGTECAVD